MGWSQFVALQVEYSLIQRTPDRDLIPMAKHFGLTVTPWAPLAGGALTGKYLRNDPGRIKEGSVRLNERAVAITREVMAIADELALPPDKCRLPGSCNRVSALYPLLGLPNFRKSRTTWER
jgi:aryl-alcohol dehydrogenase-like predicted oxidoreductase